MPDPGSDVLLAVAARDARRPLWLRAESKRPLVNFLAEPTTGLDPEGRLEVWKTVKELAGSGVTILLTTQYLDEAEQLADKIAILNVDVHARLAQNPTACPGTHF